VEDGIKCCVVTPASGRGPLDLLQNRRPQHRVAERVAAVDASDGCGEQIAAVLAAAERVDDCERIARETSASGWCSRRSATTANQRRNRAIHSTLISEVGCGLGSINVRSRFIKVGADSHSRHR
jgi:hypothetical protein